MVQPQLRIHRLNVSADHPLRIPRRKRYLLPVESLHPNIRLAHRVTGRLAIPTRIIFDHEFVLILRGNGQVITPAGPITYGPHSLLLIEPFVPHEFQGEGTCEHIAIHFDLAPGFPSRGSDPSSRRPYCVDISHGMRFPSHCNLIETDPVARALMDALDQWRRGEAVSRLQASASLIRTMVLLSQRHSNPRPERTQRHALRITRIIQEQWRTIRNVSQICSQTDLSASQINRITRAWLGESAMQLTRRTKVEHARALLAEGRPVKEVAALCNFATPYHFSKVFRAIDGLPPSEYQATVLKA